MGAYKQANLKTPRKCPQTGSTLQKRRYQRELREDNPTKSKQCSPLFETNANAEEQTAPVPNREEPAAQKQPSRC